MTSFDSTATIDARRTERLNCMWPGTISFGGVAITTCVVKDISETGLRLLVPADTWVPDEFVIDVAQIAVPMSAVIRWRRGELLGARFVGQAETKKPIPDLKILENR